MPTNYREGPPRKLTWINFCFLVDFLIVFQFSKWEKVYIFQSEELAYKSEELEIKVHSCSVFRMVCTLQHWLFTTNMFAQVSSSTYHDLNIYHEMGHVAEAVFPPLSCSNVACQRCIWVYNLGTIQKEFWSIYS